MTGANVAFNVKGAYQRNAVEIKLSTDGGELRVGMKKAIATTFDWTCFDNARLYYRKGIDTDGINSNVPSSVFNAQSVYDLNGREVNSKIKNQKSKLPKGIYIVDGKKKVLK